MTTDNSLIRSTCAAPAALRNLPSPNRMHRSPTRCLAYRSPGYLSSLAIAAFGPATVLGAGGNEGGRERRVGEKRESVQSRRSMRKPGCQRTPHAAERTPASRTAGANCDTDVRLRRAPVRFLQAFETFSSEASSWTSCCESLRHGRTFGREPFFTIAILHHNTQEAEHTHNSAAKNAGAQSHVGRRLAT